MERCRDLSGEQIRQLIDTEQLFEALRDAESLLARRFAGSMVWKTVKGRRYLYRKTTAGWFSLGSESAATQVMHAAFHDGRTAAKARIAALDARMRAIGPVNRAMRLGRVPRVAARILRRLDRAGLLGRGLLVVGTHAMFAYERMAAIHYDGDVLATRDVDLILDARRRLSVVDRRAAGGGLLDLLRAADSSFQASDAGSYRAVNDTGFMVDLIMPLARRAAFAPPRRTLIDGGPDLVAAEIAGLVWLESAPSVTATVLDDAGYPARIVAPDPRAFACHKAWLADRPDRDAAKRRRDAAQAAAVARTVATYLPGLSFDDPALRAVPLAVVRKGAALAVPAGDPAPDWR